MRKIRFHIVPNYYSDSGYNVVIYQRRFFWWVKIGTVISSEQFQKFMAAYRQLEGTTEGGR